MSESLIARRRRAVAVISLSVAVLVAAAVVYLAPSFRSLPVAALPVSGPALQTATDETISFDFLDPTRGWAAAATSITSSRMSIYATTDGARSWKQTGTINGLSGAYPVSGFRFFDRLHGYIEVGANQLAAYRTADGGHTWIPMDLPPNTWFLTFVDADHAWASTPYAPVFMRAYATADGGATWSPLPKLPVEGSLSFSSRVDGWLSPADSLDLYATHDGGLTWASVDLPPPAGQGFFSENGSPIEILADGGVVARDFGSPSEYVSFDEGATWRGVKLPDGVNDFSGIAYLDAMHWWLFTGPELFKTSDGGATWTLVSDRVVYGDLRPTILDSRHAWAEVRAGDDPSPGRRQNTVWELEMSSDGGVTWTTKTVPIPV